MINYIGKKKISKRNETKKTHRIFRILTDQTITKKHDPVPQQ